MQVCVYWCVCVSICAHRTPWGNINTDVYDTHLHSSMLCGRVTAVRPSIKSPVVLLIQNLDQIRMFMDATSDKQLRFSCNQQLVSAQQPLNDTALTGAVQGPDVRVISCLTYVTKTWLEAHQYPVICLILISWCLWTKACFQPPIRCI